MKHEINTWYKRIRHALELSIKDMETIIKYGQAASRDHMNLVVPSKSRIRAWALSESDVNFRRMNPEEFDWFTKGLTPFFEEEDERPRASIEELEGAE